MRWFGGLIILLLATNGIAQSIKGNIKEALSFDPVIGANIAIAQNRTPKNTSSGISTDNDGRFELDLEPGRYNLLISAVGYEQLLIQEVLVKAGKQLVLDVELNPATYRLGEVVISANSQNEIDGIRSITMEETMRYAATYFDPARLTLSLPAVAATNDQNNNISVRGNSPNHLRWRLEGVEIVNPNHLSNAGTLSDRPSQNGGGVNILSTQMMSNSSFVYGAFDATYGNSIGGIFDIGIRAGNKQKREYTLQAGLLGFDASAEGPIKRGGASYLVNYRYSTVGLLSAMGVDFGGESIGFQDLAFNINVPLKRGNLKLFAMGGVSTNEFEGLNDPSEWEEDKDRSDIKADGHVGAAGISFDRSLGGGILQLTSVFSSQKSVRDEQQRDLTGFMNASAYDYYRESLSSTHLSWAKSVGIFTYEVGSYLNLYDYRITRQSSNIRFNDLVPMNIDDEQIMLLTPYIDTRWQISQKLELALGIQGNYQNLNPGFQIDPRAALTYQVNEKNKLRLASGGYSQVMSPFIYYNLRNSVVTDGYRYPNKAMGLLSSQVTNLSWQRVLSERTTFRTEVYWQHYVDVPVSINSDFSVLNYFDGDAWFRLTPEGSGDTYGWETTLEQKLSKDFYYLVSLSFIDSRFTTLEGEEYDTRFNTNYALNITTGKEFVTKRGNGFSVNVRSIWQGGLRDYRIGVDQAPFFLFPTQEGDPFAFQYEDYFRWDLRLAWTKNKPNYTRMIYLDIQNLTNRKNTAFYDFDEVQQGVVRREQLGLIPILTYRVEF
ncbi:MAG: carboxypeptidase regulatory-like domain-containing protein [Cyclobacteriaceae bacterium]